MLETFAGTPHRRQPARRRGHDREAQAGPRGLSARSSASGSGCGRTAPRWRWRSCCRSCRRAPRSARWTATSSTRCTRRPASCRALEDIRALAGDALVDVVSRAGGGRLGAALARVPAAGAGRLAGRAGAVGRGRPGRPRDRPGRVLRRRHARDDAAVPASCCSTRRPAAALCDWGAGTGVLAVAAARLGFEPVTAVEVDPGALEVIRRNAALNGVAVAASGSTSPRRRRRGRRGHREPDARAAAGGRRGDRAAAGAAARLRDARATRSTRWSAAFGRLGLREQRRVEEGEWAAVVLGRDPARGARARAIAPSWCSRSCSRSRRAGSRSATSTPTPSSTRSTARPASCRTSATLRAVAGGALVDVSTSEVDDGLALARLAPAARRRAAARAGAVGAGARRARSTS